jgi:hypothetical protein
MHPHHVHFAHAILVGGHINVKPAVFCLPPVVIAVVVAILPQFAADNARFRDADLPLFRVHMETGGLFPSIPIPNTIFMTIFITKLLLYLVTLSMFVLTIILLMP